LGVRDGSSRMNTRKASRRWIRIEPTAPRLGHYHDGSLRLRRRRPYATPHGGAPARRTTPSAQHAYKRSTGATFTAELTLVVTLTSARTACTCVEYWGTLSAPKSEYSRGTVPPSAHVCLALWHRRSTADDDALVFPSRTGGYLNPANYQPEFEPAAAAPAAPPPFASQRRRHPSSS